MGLRSWFCMFVLVAPAISAARPTIHVAPCGNDSWTGLSEGCAAPDGPKRTIQAAIDAASDGDTVLVASGIYTGDGNRNLDTLGKRITVTSKYGAYETEIDCESTGQHRGFFIHSGETRETVIEGFTIRRGRVFVGPNQGGFAILALESSPTIRGCLLTENGSGSADGGAIKCLGGSPLLENCRIAGNTTAFTGGAIFCNGATLDVVECEFSNNGSGTSGGAMYLQSSTVSAVHCRFVSNNCSDAGSTIAAFDSAVSLMGCRIEGGHAGLLGTLYAGGTRLTVRSSSIVGADVQLAGGVVYGNADTVLLNSMIVNNDARSAIECTVGRLTMSGCTIVGNRPKQPTGAAAGIKASESSVITNSIVWDNGGPEILGTPAVRYSCVEGGYQGIGNIEEPPLFVNANGGNVQLGPGSPCIDRGANHEVALGCLLDIVSRPRFFDDPNSPNLGSGQPPLVDIGAYEFQGSQCYADCNADGQLTIADFGCFQAQFVAGCP